MSTPKQRNVTEEFECEAVQLTETSGRTVAQVAGDLGIGKSTLTRWKTQFKEADILSGPHDDVREERTRLRLENKILRQERDS